MEKIQKIFYRRHIYYLSVEGCIPVGSPSIRLKIQGLEERIGDRQWWSKQKETILIISFDVQLGSLCLFCRSWINWATLLLRGEVSRDVGWLAFLSQCYQFSTFSSALWFSLEWNIDHLFWDLCRISISQFRIRHSFSHALLL